MARGKKKEKELTPEEKLQQALVPVEEQPYEVPDNWCWTRLFSCVITSKEKTDEFSDERLKYVGLEHMEKDSGIIGYGSALGIRSLKNVFHKDQILYGKLRPYLNKHDIATFDGVCSTDILVFSNTACVLAPYVNYYFNQSRFIEYVVNNSKGINLPRVSEQIVLNAVIPLPPLPEQQRIVNRIESLFAKLDEAKEKAQAVVDGFEDRKAAILHKAFRGDLSISWRKQHKGIDTSWKKHTIGDLFLHTTGKALKKSNNHGTLRKYITTSNLYWGRFDFSEVREMYFENNELEKCTAQKGDLLICNGGDVGRAAIWCYDYNICLQNHISKLRKKDENVEISFFYYYFMLSKLKGMINSRGIGISSLSAKDLLVMEVELPSVEEQRVICHILNQLFDREQKGKENAEQVIDQIDLMKKSILARAFRGELGTNDPSDESADELLKRFFKW